MNQSLSILVAGLAIAIALLIDGHLTRATLEQKIEFCAAQYFDSSGNPIEKNDPVYISKWLECAEKLG